MSQAARILIVDDESSIRLTLGALLQRAGYDVTAAENGAEAVALFERQTFDLMLVDLKMPGMDGMQVVAAAAFLPRRDGAVPTRRASVTGIPWLLLALAVVAGVSASGAPLAAFNGVERLFGGKRAVLVDSNLDWGQALPDLRDWQKRERVGAVQLAYFGRVDPSLYGITWSTLPSHPVRGPVAISATFAAGRPYAVLMKEKPSSSPTRAWSSSDTWTWLRELPPDEELGGGAILVWKDIGPALDAAKSGKGR